MKKLLIAAALVGAPVVAQAADLPAQAYKKAPPMVVQAYNWTGFYIGVNGGGGFGRSKTDLVVPGGIDARSRVGGAGATGGGQIGYNWQAGNFGLGNVVLGLEADIQGSGFDDGRTCTFICPVAGPVGLAINQKLDWFGTVRGRFGIATGPVLSYVTAGFAYGDVKTTITDLSNTVPSRTFNGTRTGWTVGSGVEAALGGNWTGKVEYLYLDLGTQAGIDPVFPYSYASEIREHVFRAGLNYRIGGTGTYAAEPVANWAGFYIGGNGGGATALNKSDLTVTTVVNERFNLSPDGYFGGGQIGYNWQAGNVVAGLEADIQGGSLKDDYACTLQCNVAVPILFTYNQKMDWFGTARGRLGYSVGSTLFYGTGGVAFGNVKTDIVGAVGPVVFNQSFSLSRTGYAVGGGIESPFEFFGWFGKNWTSKTEYLFVDLGRSTDSFAFGGSTAVFSTRVQEHMLRTGLNYHFNSPVVAKY